jgi:methyltransferase (TIGR00027 family)
VEEAAGEARASRTALGAAAIRAAHWLVDGEPRILDDPIAARLIDAHDLERLVANGQALGTVSAKRLRTHVLLRSRYAEDRLARAARRGIGQLVVLGAGLDSFAYRQPDWARSLRIFEVDHPASQNDKRRRLAAAGIEVPGNVEFVGVDFERMSLGEGLRASALDLDRPTFFLCLGVLVYLTGEAAQEIFQLVARFPPGTEIVFTFSRPRSSLSDLAGRAAALGEPWLTRWDPRGLQANLRKLGFSRVLFLGQAEAKRAIGARTDGLRAPARPAVAAAVV